jgi:ketosteroid isomerase-like protein
MALAFNRGDLEAAFAGVGDDVEWELPAEFPGAETLRGRGAVLAYYDGALREWQNVVLVNKEVLSVDASGFVSTYSLRFEGSETNLRFEMEGTQTTVIERGRIARISSTVERSRALD